MNQTHRGTPGPVPTMPDGGRAQWAREARVYAERVKYAARTPISVDDITNLRIVLGTAQTVQDVIERA